ncbi:unnamed protein product, partial [Urochloa humidicola]
PPCRPSHLLTPAPLAPTAARRWPSHCRRPPSASRTPAAAPRPCARPPPPTPSPSPSPCPPPDLAIPAGVPSLSPISTPRASALSRHLPHRLLWFLRGRCWMGSNRRRILPCAADVRDFVIRRRPSSFSPLDSPYPDAAAMGGCTAVDQGVGSVTGGPPHPATSFWSESMAAAMELGVARSSGGALSVSCRSFRLRGCSFSTKAAWRPGCCLPLPSRTTAGAHGRGVRWEQNGKMSGYSSRQGSCSFQGPDC